MRRYQLRVRLARGGLAEIWLAVQRGAEGFRRAVVLKRALAGPGLDQSAANRALIDEACIASGLNHPNIVHVYELLDTEHGLMMAMEYLHGLSLRALLRGLAVDDVALPIGPALRIGADVARALAYAHEAFGPRCEALAVVHRDVSPENVVVTTSGISKLIDFGIATTRAETDDVTVDERTGFAPALGKRLYAAPEQLDGRRADWKADVYSFGMMLEEIVGGPAGMGPARPGVPPPIRDVIARATVIDPARRRLRAEEMADLLEGCANDLGASHRDVAQVLSRDLGAAIDAVAKLVASVLEADDGPEIHSVEESDTVSAGGALDTLIERAPEVLSTMDSTRRIWRGTT